MRSFRCDPKIEDLKTFAANHVTELHLILPQIINPVYSAHKAYGFPVLTIILEG